MIGPISRDPRLSWFSWGPFLGSPLGMLEKVLEMTLFEKGICEQALLGQFPGILAQGAFFNSGNLARGSFQNRGIQLGILIRIKEP